MESVAVAVVIAAVALVACFVALRGAGAASQVMVLMFRSPAELGWPSGVQEDDDFHWRWAARAAASGAGESGPRPGDGRPWAGAWVVEPDARPEIVELAVGLGPRAAPVSRS